MKKKTTKMKMMLITVCLLVLLTANVVFAAGDPVIVTGTKKLVADGTKILTGLVAGVTTVMALFRGIAWQTADDEHKPKHKKEVIDTLKIGVLLTCIMGIVAWIFSYYGA